MTAIPKVYIAIEGGFVPESRVQHDCTFEEYLGVCARKETAEKLIERRKADILREAREDPLGGQTLEELGFGPEEEGDRWLIINEHEVYV